MHDQQECKASNLARLCIVLNVLVTQRTCNPQCHRVNTIPRIESRFLSKKWLASCGTAHYYDSNINHLNRDLLRFQPGRILFNVFFKATITGFIKDFFFQIRQRKIQQEALMQHRVVLLNKQALQQKHVMLESVVAKGFMF